MKVCSKCKIEKEDGEFNKKTKTRLQPYCRICHNEHNRSYYDKHKQRMKKQILVKNKKRRIELKEFVNNLKSKPCIDCGQSYHPYVMDFDHLSDKIKDVSIMVHQGHSKENILKEISKCDIVCSNCHRMRTLKRNNYFEK
jgi:hypothetical protein